jgi:hypothetical protein
VESHAAPGARVPWNAAAHSDCSTIVGAAVQAAPPPFMLSSFATQAECSASLSTVVPALSCSRIPPVISEEHSLANFVLHASSVPPALSSFIWSVQQAKSDTQ